MDITETLEQAAHRELAEETGVVGLALEPLLPFDAPDRDPRKRVITMAYLALIGEEEADLPVQAGDDAAAAQWWPVAHLPSLAFDHDHILATARAHLCRRLLHEDLGRRLLPGPFTARQINRAFAAVLGEPVVSRSILRVLRAAGVIAAIGGGRYRYL
jgi:8-oxo-dGTP diphosphatase